MTLTVPQYLFKRLRQLGVDTIHGVPGDYNLTLLDYVEPAGLKWVGNCNELNAGYAADGYARIKGLSALITTFGVGELSAINAIAGAYAEFAPVVSIVGTPQRQSQDTRALIHHTLGDGDYGKYADAARHFTVAQTNLLDPRTAPAQIDEVLQQCLIHSRPVYIQLPVDMVDVHTSDEHLTTPIQRHLPATPKDETKALELVLSKIYASEHPMIYVDGQSRAYDILDELHQLVQSTHWPTWTSPFGKSLVDETIPNVRGVWKGGWAQKDIQERLDSADLVLCFGPQFSNTNSYLYTSVPDAAKTIHFKASSIQTSSETLRDIPAKQFLSKLLKKLDTSKIKGASASTTKAALSTPSELDSNGIITQDHFYRVLNSFFREEDVILAETGTAAYGCHDFQLPSNTRLLAPSTWLSIGYMLPAAQGAAQAKADINKNNDSRTVLLIGDGSFQMTAQEVSTMIREKLNIVIILINNDGYTIERCLHGWNKHYNDIAPWRYLEAASFFGAGNGPSGNDSAYQTHTFTAKTWGELQSVLVDPKLTEGAGFRMVEVFMDRESAPEILAGILQRTKAAEAGK